MLPYLLVLFLVMFWIFLEEKSLNRKAFWVPLFILAIFSSIRSYFVGSDSINYTADFRNQLDINYFYFRPEVEYGYQILKYIILLFTKNYFWLFFISSIIVLFCYLSFFKKYSKDYFLSVFIFITFGFYTFYFNGLRQGIAMAISILAIPFLFKDKFLKFFLIILIASLFHKTALIMVLFYFIINLKVKMEYKIIIVFLGSLGLSSFVIEYLALVNNKYESYAEVSEKSGGYLTLLFYFLIGIFIYIYMKKYRITSIEFNKLAQLYFCGVAFLIPVAMLGAAASGPQRFLFYFVWTVTLLLPYIFYTIKIKYMYVLFIFLSIIYFYLTTSSFSNLIPYTLNEIFRLF